MNQINPVTGEMEGYWEHHYFDGQLKSKGRYINGVQNGRWEYYQSTDGSLVDVSYYINGKCNFQMVYWNDKLMNITFLNDRRNRFWIK